MHGVILVGHGSLRKASGAAMIRLAALIRNHNVAPIATAGFLNFSQPTFADAVARCVNKGAKRISVQPYFLISGHYVDTALPALVNEAKKTYPDIHFTCADAFGHHPALTKLIIKRVEQANAQHADAFILMAHGTPHPDANFPIYKIASDLEKHYKRHVTTAFMEINTPGIPECISHHAHQKHSHITAIPYFLQLGNHVRHDLPNTLTHSQQQHPHLRISLTEHLGYDPLLLNVIRDRLQEQPAHTH